MARPTAAECQCPAPITAAFPSAIPALRATAPSCPMPEADAGVSYELDPDYLEHAHREALDNQDQPDLPWDA